MLLQHVLHGNMKHVDHSKRCCDDEHLLRKGNGVLCERSCFPLRLLFRICRWRRGRMSEVGKCRGIIYCRFTRSCLLCASDVLRRRPYRAECTGFLLTSEVKQRRARSVLGWGTAWEDLRVLSAFSSLRCVVLLCRSLGEQSVSRGVHGQSQQ